MSIRQMIRNTIVDIARPELAAFLEENEEALIKVFREEIQRLDDQIPEERAFIDIKMVPLGEMILRACLHAFRRFLVEAA